MKLWIRTLFKDLLAIALLLSLFYFSGKKYLEMVSQKIRGAGDPIGVVTDVAYYPKRQLSGDDYTNNLSREDELYEGDLVTSDSFSSILMNLVDGTEISLENGSKIILRLRENTIYFDGTISALSTRDREEPLQLINMGEENPLPIILSQASEITISTDDKGVFKMAVLTGEATRGKEKIEENEQFLLKPTGETSVNVMSFIQTFPPNNSSWLTFGETQKIRFAWEEPNRADSRTLWIALDTDFQRIVYRADDLRDLSYELDLLPGDYFWRVGNSDLDQYSSTGKIRIVDNLPLKALAPTDGQELTYRDTPPAQTFQWQGAESADFWELEIGTMDNGNLPLITERTRYNQIRINDLAEGDYWWRVSAQYGGMENVTRTAPTPAGRLKISRLLELQPPRLIAPEPLAVLTPEEFAEGVRFSWKGDSEIPLYQFTLSPNENMSDPLVRENTSKNYFLVNEELLPDQYFWQIVPLTDGTVPVENSEIRSLLCRERVRNLELLSPRPNEAVTLERGASLPFIWDSSEKENFRFRLWKVTGDVEKIIANSRVDRLELAQYIAEEGDYRWQVDLMDEKGAVALEGSKYTFSVKTPLLPPRLIYPEPDSTISLIGEEILPLAWSEVGNSRGYTGALYKGNGLEPVLSIQETVRTAFDVDIDLLTRGDYTLELQSVRDDDGKGFSPTSVLSRSSFTIGDIISYVAPVITSPRAGTETNRLEVLQNGLPIGWTSSYDFPSYEIVLKQKDSGTLLLRRVTSRKTFTIDDLYPDSYSVEVRGIDSENRTSPMGETDVTVLTVEPLAPVRVTSPARGSIVDMSDRDSLEFSWRPTEAGETYTIALYSREGSRIFQTDDFRGTNYSFTDLSKLDVGDFTFTVKAVKEYNDIGIVRSSPETRVDFAITIKSIGAAPVILSPDIQYAD